jgi:hypothetical protein
MSGIVGHTRRGIDTVVHTTTTVATVAAVVVVADV